MRLKYVACLRSANAWHLCAQNSLATIRHPTPGRTVLQRESLYVIADPGVVYRIGAGFMLVSRVLDLAAAPLRAPHEQAIVSSVPIRWG